MASIRAVARAVDVHLSLEPRWRGADLPRLMDERHAAIVGCVVGELQTPGWQVRVEYSFNWRGERGTVDVLAWHPDTRALLIVEVKTQIVDVQELLSTLDRKRRLVPLGVAVDLGWRPSCVGCLVALPEETRARAAITRHEAVFSAVLPSRNASVRRWLRAPADPIAGILFLRFSNASNGRRALGPLTRVRRAGGGQMRASPRSIRVPGPATRANGGSAIGSHGT